MKIDYSVNGRKFSTEINVNDTVTPRSIVYSCLSDFQRKTGEKVTQAHHDDDNAIYARASHTVKVVMSDELYKLPSTSGFGFTKKEIREMFSN